MQIFLIFVGGIALGFWLGRMSDATTPNPLLGKGGEGEGKSEPLIERQKREKDAHKEAILKMFESKSTISNNDVERGLSVSDATATRYLEELEKEGKVRQIGEIGSGVRYEAV